MNPYSKYNLARPSFFEGIMRIFDIGNTMQRYSATDAKKDDIDAINSDWECVGQDIMDAIDVIANHREQCK